MLLLLIFIGLPVVTTAALVLLVLKLTNAPSAPSPAVKRSVRIATASLMLGILAVIPASAYLVITDRFGRGVTLLVPVALICVQMGLLGSTVAIDFLPRSRGAVRTAPLVRRRTTDVVPIVLSLAAVIATVAAFAGLVTTTRTASIDEFSGAMRQFSTSNGSFGPYFGSYYSIPILVALGVSVTLTVLVILGSHRWGALDQVEADLTLRLRVAARSVAATALLAGYVLAITGFMLRRASLEVLDSPDPVGGWSAVQYVAPAAIVVGIAIGMWSAFVFLVPTLRPQR